MKNMYVEDKTFNKWISINSTTLGYFTGANNGNTGGTLDYGFTKTYFYGSSG